MEYRWAATGLAATVMLAVAGCSTSPVVNDIAEPTTTTVSTSHTTTPPTPTIDPYLGLPLIDHVTWTSNVDGDRLLVFPTVAGRKTAAPDGEARAWQEVVALDGSADSPGMRDQFRCHWVWARLVAPDKPSWNLEPWRPDVGYDAVVAANCNPGGPER
ncbi:DUF2599 domain-containing protein [Nocardia camponoti]|uniref:DUF2599 domain-containing protein n=1 Tax=Nocardia camponoti TaxID=1616106 RepID=A0A917Q834_9NOCA|nr:DUF2599 domain-containing protein [Nocardia camponoti]GGK34918.1 hypothetical protein GCM10011591_03190 [Nocardia camponoti]